ncbi:helix-turn-helix transcriptional regulator [Roseateles sp. LYH14W]|uniref:Helix-turn-helix transcriptional regulator n=1 Tax=Pelomonas parva TaxID=3299032 RepID=A0ABW7F930_9BURK
MHSDTPNANATATTPTEAQTSVFVRMPKLRQMTGLGRTTIYRLMAQNLFPNPVRLGPRAVGWRVSDIDAWSAARPVAAH